MTSKLQTLALPYQKCDYIWRIVLLWGEQRWTNVRLFY